MPEVTAVESVDAGSDHLGPIDYLIVEFPDGTLSQGGFDTLLDLVDRRVIALLDLEFIAKDAEGVARPIAVEDVAPGEGVDLSVWAGAASGLLGADDLAEIGAQLAPGSIALVVVFENLWVLGMVDGWVQHGARLIADGGLGADEVVAALDATDPIEGN